MSIRKSLFLAMGIAAVFMIVIYQAANYRIPISAEKANLQLFEKIRSLLFGPLEVEPMDSVVMIDVHYDKQMVVERDGNLANGMVPVTSREKLLRLLTELNLRGDYRYILLDVFLEQSVSQPHDTTLYRLIARMPRIVIARTIGTPLADSSLYKKAGIAQYGTAIWENDFVKYPYVTDGIPSIPLKMYQELTGRDIHRHWCNFYTDHGLARNSVILTYEYADDDMAWDLGSGLLGDSIDSEPTTPGLQELDTKGKYILIGDFEDDRHETFIGNLSGTVINFNAYLSLLRHHHLISFWLILSLFVIFTILAWQILTDSCWCTFISIPMFLFVICMFTYLVCHEVYDVLVATTLFWLLKFAVKTHNTLLILRKENKLTILNIMRRIFFTLLFFVAISSSLEAKRLTITQLRNCHSIQVGRKTLKKGDSFESWQVIQWTTARQMAVVRDNLGKTYRLSHKGFKQQNAKTADEYFIAEHSLGTRQITKAYDNYSRHRFFMTAERDDTLMFPTKSRATADMYPEAIWQDNRQQNVVTRIRRSADGQFYIITPSIWHNRTPQDVNLTIREISSDGSWVENVYQQILIILP